MDLGPLKVLIVAILGLGLMLGLVSRKKVGKIIGRILFIPILILMVWSFFKNILNQYPPEQQIFVILIGVGSFLFILMLTTQFGRQVIASFFGTLLFSIVKGIFSIFSGMFRGILRLFGRN